jgi:short-subunit dehydrogenase
VAKAGLNLILVARRRENLNPFAEALSTDHRIETKVIATDLSEHAGVWRIVNETRHVDTGVLVASAGFGISGSFIDAPLKQEVVMLNIDGRA